MEDDFKEHLSRLSTLWTELEQARGGSADEARAARNRLMQRYYGAVFRYLRAAVKNEDLAFDLSQTFAERFLEGRFDKANPARGRFRDYVKQALRNLVRDHQRERQRAPRPLAFDLADPAQGQGPESEDHFLDDWRREILRHSWKALSECAPVQYAVLDFQTRNLEESRAEIARQLGAQLGRTFTVGAIRAALSRARRKLGRLVRAEVARSLGEPTEQELLREIRTLGLGSICELE